MAGKVIDTTLRFIDKFTTPMLNMVNVIEKSSSKIQKSGENIKKTGDNISKIGSGMKKGITTSIIDAGMASFELANDLNESMNNVDIVFKKSAGNINKWSKTTLESFGLSQNTALETASVYGNMATGIGLNTKQAANMSKKLVGLSADLSSYKNVSQEVAADALKGIFTGDGESLKNLGITMTDASLQAYALDKGLLKSTVSQAKLKELSNKTAIAQSDLAAKTKKYGDNSLVTKKAQMTLNDAVKNQAAAAKVSYNELTQAQKVQLRYKYVLDKTKDAQGDFARTSNNVTNQQKTLREGIKELETNFGQNLLPIGSKILQCANKLVTKLNGLTESQQNLIIKILAIAAAAGPVLLIFGKLTFGIGSTVLTIGKFGGVILKSVGVINYFVKAGKSGILLIGKFGGAILKSVKAINYFAKVGKMGSLLSKFGNMGKTAFMAITSPAGLAVIAILAIAVAAFLIIKNWTKVKAFLKKMGSYIKDVFIKSGIDTEKLAKTFNIVKNSIGKTVNSLQTILKRIITFLKPVMKFISGTFLVNLKTSFIKIIAFLKPVMKFISGTFLVNLKTSFTKIIAFLKFVMRSLGVVILVYIKVSFASLIGMVAGFVNGVHGIVLGFVRILKGIIVFIKGVFTGNWKQVWEGLKDIFRGVFESLVEIAKTPLNMLIGMINGAIVGINKLGFKIPSWVPNLGGKSFSINIPTIPMLAKGTQNWTGGLAITQEHGGEIMDLPRGTRVYPHDKSLQIAKAEGTKSGGNVYVNVNKLADKMEIRSDDDIDNFVNKFANKLEKISFNSGRTVLV